MNQPHPRAGDAVLARGFRRPLRRRHAGDRHRGDQDRPAVCHDRLVSARRTPRLCTWWNAIGCLTTKPRKKGWNGTQKKISARSVDIDRSNYKGKDLQIHFTVEDAGVFTMPWTATMTYGRDSSEWPEVVCAENTHEYYTTRTPTSRHADKPDF